MLSARNLRLVRRIAELAMHGCKQRDVVHVGLQPVVKEQHERFTLVGLLVRVHGDATRLELLQRYRDRTE
jgi:hypothetical protein